MHIRRQNGLRIASFDSGGSYPCCIQEFGYQVIEQQGTSLLINKLGGT